MYPKARLETLSDGIFGVAMTLLVLDIRLPDDFHPRDQHELMVGLLDLTPKFIPYIISFFVLGLRWLSNVRAKSESETVSFHFARVWLLYHFLITAVPFTTIVLGRFPEFGPSIWLYAGNTALLAVLALWMMHLMPDTDEAQAFERRFSLFFLIGSSIIAILASFVVARYAMWALALNVFAPLARPTHRVLRGSGKRRSEVGRAPRGSHNGNDPDPGTDLPGL
jgi:uncharacterized membrane protein